jgi:acyl dehydratase
MNRINIEKSVTAFMENPNAPRPDNEIHSTDGGKAYGYRGALVGGVDVYGWGTRLVLDVLGNSWLDNGWAEVSFRRPAYPGDELIVKLIPGGEDCYEFYIDQKGGQHCIAGKVGCNNAAWLKDLYATGFRAAEERSASLPQLTMQNAPVGKNLKSRSVFVAVDEAVEFARNRQADQSSVYCGDQPRIHPAWLAGQMTHLLHHSYDYGPAIHTASQIQNLAPAFAGQTVTVTGHCREVYERKGHHYIVNDGSIWSAQGNELVRLRHKAIFRLKQLVKEDI